MSARVFSGLSLTQVADLAPLHGLHSLQSLNLSYTKVTDLVPLQGLTSLRSLNLWDTPVSGEQIESLEAALPKLEIDR